MNNDEAVAICFALPALISKSIGLKKIPPPIPTIPEINPIADPIMMDKIFGTLFTLISLLLYDLLSMNKNTPAIIKITNNNISNSSLVISIEAPKNEKGIEPIKYGKSKLKLRLPDLT